MGSGIAADTTALNLKSWSSAKAEAERQALLAHASTPPHAVNTTALKTFAPAMRRQLLEAVFEGLDVASELLLSDDLLSDGSIAGGFRSQISDSDCEDVEIIGWLY